VKLEFCTDFRKNTQIPNFLKIRPVGAELFHADGRTDRRLIQTVRLISQHYKTAGISNQWRSLQWPRDLRRRSSAARLLRLWVRIPLGAWMFVCYECCVLSGRGLCVGLITRPEESYRLWRVVCNQETSKNEEDKACYRAVKLQPQWVVTPGKQTNTSNKYTH
jgi:hypothetical protein